MKQGRDEVFLLGVRGAGGGREYQGVFKIKSKNKNTDIDAGIIGISS